MEIRTATDRTNEFISELLNVWEASVRATHNFLSDDDINAIKPHVQQGLAVMNDLLYTVDKKGSISGFMAVENEKIEMLFIHPVHRGDGIGKKLIYHAISVCKAAFVDVNEQNIQGVGFYKHVGFKIIDRSPLDANGNPFPLLHMRILHHHDFPC